MIMNIFLCDESITHTEQSLEKLAVFYPSQSVALRTNDGLLQLA